MSLSKSKAFLTGVLLAVLLAVTGSAMALDGMRLWKPYQPESFGGARRGSDGFYAGIDAILWKIEPPRGLQAFKDQYKNNPSSGMSNLTLDTLATDFRLGTRLTVGNRRGHHGWLFSGYGLSGASGSISTETMSWDTMPGQIVHFQTLYEEFDYTADIFLIKTANPTLTTKTNIISLELMYSYRPHSFSWGNAELYAGARYWDFDDKLIFSDDIPLIGYEVDRFQPPLWLAIIRDRLADPEVDLEGLAEEIQNLRDLEGNPSEPLGVLFEHSELRNARNRITGPQIGVNLSRSNQRWTFGADFRFMAGINGQSFTYSESNNVLFKNTNFVGTDSNERIFNLDQLPDTDITSLTASQLRILNTIKENFEGGSRYLHTRRTVFSPGVEMQLSAKWQWTDAVGIKLGFNTTAFDNIARGSDVVYTKEAVTGADGAITGLKENFSANKSSRAVLTYGVNLGLEMRR